MVRSNFHQLWDVAIEKCDWCTDYEAVCPTGAISCPFDIVIENPVR